MILATAEIVKSYQDIYAEADGENMGLGSSQIAHDIRDIQNSPTVCKAVVDLQQQKRNGAGGLRPGEKEIQTERS